jgi:hypothetical protein
MGQLKYVNRSSGNIHTTYLYHPQNDAGGGGLGDSNFRLKTIQHGETWPDFTYEYDDVGNITKMTTVSTAGTDSQSFGYDHLNRLTSASATGVAPTYSDVYGYNKLGNLTNNDGTTQSYSSSSHVHAVTSAGGVTYSYESFFLTTGNAYRWATSHGGLGNYFMGATLAFPPAMVVAPHAKLFGDWFNSPLSVDPVKGMSPVYWYSSAIWEVQSWSSD